VLSKHPVDPFAEPNPVIVTQVTNLTMSAPPEVSPVF
jgi:hypothetical protein